MKYSLNSQSLKLFYTHDNFLIKTAVALELVFVLNYNLLFEAAIVPLGYFLSQTLSSSFLTLKIIPCTVFANLILA